MLYMADACNGGGQRVFWMLSVDETIRQVQFGDSIP